VLVGARSLETTTEDIGSRGCQVILPDPLQRGAAVVLTLEAPRLPDPLRIDGRVVWVSPRPPWRVGIAYSGNGLNDAARWMESFRQSSPELFRRNHPPVEHVAVEAMVFLGVAPKLPEFTEDELTVLRAIGSGKRVAELRTALSANRTWPRMQRSLFSLLNRGEVTLSRAASAHPVTWKAILGEQAAPASAAVGVAEDELALDKDDLVLESLLERSSLPPPAAPPPKRAAPPEPRRGAPATPGPRRAAPASPGPPPLPPQPRTTPAAMPPPPPPPLPAAAPRVPPRPEVQAQPSAPGPRRDFVGAGVGWRNGAVRPRSPEADAFYQLGLNELEGKRTQQALSVLRRALALAPGDPEIAHAIGRAMKG
jgi:hypothetical protein